MPGPSSTKPEKLLDQLRDAIRIKHYSYSTEKTYVHWAKRYIHFYNKRHPAEMGALEIVWLRPALDGITRRHHLDPSGLQRAVKAAAKLA